MVRLFLPLLLVLALAVACSRDPSQSLEKLPEADALRAATTHTLSFQGEEISFNAEVARDFMPGAGVNGLMVSGTLKRVPTRASMVLPQAFPEGLRIEQLYVLRGDRVWAPEVRGLWQGSTRSFFRAGANDGPIWDQDQPVDVFARVTIPEGGTLYLAVRGQQIRRVQ